MTMKQRINIFNNRKQRLNRSLYMRIATTIFSILIYITLMAQESSLPLDKLPLKNLLKQVSYVPVQSFTSLSYTGKDSVSFYGPRVASVPGFYISKTELTNREYREFTQYVKDSLAHTLLTHFRNDTHTIDWSQPIDWSDNRLEPLMVPPDDRIYGRKEISPDKIIFEIDFFGQKETISIYPDTLVWIRDFSYSYNEPLAKRYFLHPSYNDYPVLGISLKQAMAFCQWKTKQLMNQAGGPYDVIVRLPTSNEWESAAFNLKKNKQPFLQRKEI